MQCKEKRFEEDELRSVHVAAARTWPGVEVDLSRFARYLAERIDPADEGGLAGLPTDDLYLACACADGSSAAIAAFERAFFPEIDGVVRKHRCDVETAELQQELRQRLFVRTNEQSPRIARYSGRGSLRNWFRVTVLRSALNARRGQQARRERSTGDEVLRQLAPALSGPELEPYKAEYADALKQAFELAIEDLVPRQRLLLRYHLVDGFSIDDTGRLFNVHRSTAFRWLSAAKDELLAHTKTRLADSMGLCGGDVDSVIRLVISRLEVTLSRVL